MFEYGLIVKKAKQLSFWILFFIFFLTPLSTHASINSQINYQGKLSDSSGNPVPDGNYDVVFKIYDASSGGTTLWTGNYTAANSNPITTTDGIFSVLLGSGIGNTLNLDFSGVAYYLGVTIGTDPEMIPRKEIGAVAQAINSENVISNGYINISGIPTGTGIAQGTEYINPASAGANNTLFGVAVNGTEKFKIDAEGDVSIAGAIVASSTLNGLSVSSGTISSGTWNGTAIGASYGGTGQATYTVGDLLYASGATTLAKLAVGANGECLTSNGTNPVWGSCGVDIVADSLDFTDFNDTLTLDATTSINASGTNQINIINSGTGSSFTVNDEIGDTTPFVIDASGNVGIGISAPISKLHIDQSSSVSNTDTTGGKVILNDSGTLGNLVAAKTALEGSVSASGNYTGSGYDYFLRGVYGSAGYSGMMDSNGNVNILSVSGLSGAATFSGIIGDASDGLNVIGVNAVSGSDLGTFGDTVHIGVASAVTGTADTNMGIRASVSGVAGLNSGVSIAGVSDGTSNYGLHINAISASVNNYSIYSTAAAKSYFGGDVGIGLTNPSDKLDVAGDIRVGTGTTGCVKDADGTVIGGTCSSDRRLKKDITPMSNVLDRLTQLNPVTYHWRADEFPERNFGKDFQTGLIAQDVEALFPELVTEDASGYKQIAFQYLPFYLLQGIKEQEARIDLQTNSSEDINAILTDVSTIQTQIEDNTTKLSLLETSHQQFQSNIQTMQSQVQTLMDFYSTLQLGNVVSMNEQGNIDLLNGQLEASQITADSLVINVSNPSSPTIGTATLYPAAQDEDHDSNDDFTGKSMNDPEVTARDGKSVIVKTGAVSETAKVYITPIGSTGNQVPYVASALNGKEFSVSVDNALSESVQFNWWIVEQQ